MQRFHEYSSSGEKAPALSVTVPRVAKGKAARPCTRTAQPAQARLNLGANVVAKLVVNVPVQTKSNQVLRIRKERTTAQFYLRAVHRSCRSSVPATANPVSSPNSFPC